MNFDMQNFQELLATFTEQTQSYAATLQNNLSQLLRADQQFCKACDSKMLEIEDAINHNKQVTDKYTDLVQEKQLTQQELQQQVENIVLQTQQLEDQIARISQQIEHQNQLLNAKSTSLQQPQRVPQKLLRQYEMYRKMLQMGLKVTGNRLLVEFYGLGEQVQFVELEIAENHLKLSKMSELVDNIDNMIDEFELTGNLGLLICRIRRGFKHKQHKLTE